MATITYTWSGKVYSSPGDTFTLRRADNTIGSGTVTSVAMTIGVEITGSASKLILFYVKSPGYIKDYEKKTFETSSRITINPIADTNLILLAGENASQALNFDIKLQNSSSSNSDKTYITSIVFAFTTSGGDPSSGGSSGGGSSGGDSGSSGGGSSGGGYVPDTSFLSLTVSTNPKKVPKNGGNCEVHFGVSYSGLLGEPTFTRRDSSGNSIAVVNGGAYFFKPNEQYTFTVAKGGKTASQTITLGELPELTITLSADYVGKDVYNYNGQTYDMIGEWNSFNITNIMLGGQAALSSEIEEIVWGYRAGSSPFADLSLTEFNNYTQLTAFKNNRSLGNFDLKKYLTTAEVSGPFYAVACRVTDTNGQSVVGGTSIIKYPILLDAPTTNDTSIFNKTFTANYDNTTNDYYNNKVFLNINLPDIAKEGASSFSLVTISLLSKETNTTFNPNNFIPVITNDEVNSRTKLQYEISLDNLYYSVPRNNFFRIKVDLVDKVGKTYNFIIDKTLRRIILPYFSSNNIQSTWYNPIAVNNLTTSQQTSGLTISIPTPYTYLSDGVTTTAQDVQNLIGKLILSCLDEEYQTNIQLDSNTNLTYNKPLATGYVKLTAEQFRQLFSEEYLKRNQSYLFSIGAEIRDNFDNVTKTTFTIKFLDGTSSNYYIFSFGSPPVMSDDSSLYNLKVKYTYKSEIFDDLTSNKMINGGDTLYIEFPPATDANGDDIVTSHGDIVSYNIKVKRSDVHDDFTKSDFIQLTQIPVGDESLVYDGTTGRYLYKHIVSDYPLSKFLQIGVSAYDTTGLESNIYNYGKVLIGGRVTSSTSNIAQHQTTVSETKTDYTFKVRIKDIGGNLFNGNYSYQDYPNLERSLGTDATLPSARSVKFYVEYRDDPNSTIYSEPQLLSFKVGDSETFITEYTGNYSALLNNTITCNFSLNNGILNTSNKNFFRIKILVQTGFDSLGNRVYQEGYSYVYTIYPETPTVAYRKNAVGMNTEDLTDQLLRVAIGNTSKSVIQIDSQEVGSTERAPVIIMDLINCLINGIEISDED